MIKRLALLGAIALLSPGLCAAAQNPCPNITRAVPSAYGGVQYVNENCGVNLFGKGPSCACPDGVITQQANGFYVCQRPVLSPPSNGFITIGQHLVNGHCVPDETLAAKKTASPAALPGRTARAPLPSAHTPASAQAHPAPVIAPRAPMPAFHAAPAMIVQPHNSGASTHPGGSSRPRA